MTAPPAATAREQQLAQILLFITPAMFTTNMVMARATADFIPPVALAFWRWSGVFLVLALLCSRELWHHRAAIRADARQYLMLGFLGMVICGAGVYWGAASTTATNIGLIYATSPVIIILLSRIWFGEAMSLRQGLGTALALSGVLVIVLRGDIGLLLSLTFSLGDLLILIASVAWAVYAVLLKRWPSRLGINARLACITGAGALLLLPMLAVETVLTGAPALDGRTLLAIITLVIVPGIGAYGTYGYMTKHLGPSKTGLMLYLSPIYTALMAWALLGESFAFYHWIGSALVLPGLYLATHKPQPETA
ncbi:DMT family transporter [Ferrovibrio sp.]|uniref:DMT family transporter n=1 Tax=Ferrovibrio sp. TaxID=1917215 RepID=UPI003D299CA8